MPQERDNQRIIIIYIWMGLSEVSFLILSHLIDLVEDGCVPGHMTWDTKDKEAFDELSHLERENWRHHLSRFQTILLDTHQQEEAHPSEIRWFPTENFLHLTLDDINSWTVFKSHLMCLEFHSSRQHLSKHQWPEIINFIFTPNIYLTPKSSPSCPFSPAISTQVICLFSNPQSLSHPLAQ